MEHKGFNGLVLYRGPSLLTGAPIVALAVGLSDPSKNSKTGPLVQVQILVEEERPVDAVWSGADAAVCGDCIHRSRTGVGGRRTHPT